jgi:hypothetical protein
MLDEVGAFAAVQCIGVTQSMNGNLTLVSRPPTERLSAP